jgi:hypothetical protein
MTTTINITWHQPDERSEGREDSAWYSYSADHHDIVASVSNGERTIHIYADGEVRVHLAYNDIFEMAEEGLIEWVSNSWFDLYAEGQGWADCVQHTLSDAIESAVALLSDESIWDD